MALHWHQSLELAFPLAVCPGARPLRRVAAGEAKQGFLVPVIFQVVLRFSPHLRVLAATLDSALPGGRCDAEHQIASCSICRVILCSPCYHP